MYFAKGHACACPFDLRWHEPQNKDDRSMPAHSRGCGRDAVSAGGDLEILAGLDISGTASDSDAGGVHLFRRARSTVGRAQAAEQRKNWRAETDYEIRETHFLCRFPDTGI